MKKLSFSLLGLALLSYTGLSKAATIEANVMADNDFIVVHSQGSNHNVVHRGNYGRQWHTMEAFEFEIDTSPRAIKQCSVSIIAWGDGSRYQGLAAILKGSRAVYTGSGDFMAYQSNITSSGYAQTGGPNASQIASLVSDSLNNPVASTYALTGTVAGGTRPWGSFNFPLATSVDASKFRWTWPTSNLRQRSYSIFTTPCGQLVGAVDMPGEHFQCYKLNHGDALPKEVIQIEDQFGRSKAVLGKPELLCNPSAKVHGDKRFDIKRAERHLVCYSYRKQEKIRKQKLAINNQFGPDEVDTVQRELFCVPSSKEHLPIKGEQAAKDFGKKELQRGRLNR